MTNVKDINPGDWVLFPGVDPESGWTVQAVKGRQAFVVSQDGQPARTVTVDQLERPS